MTFRVASWNLLHQQAAEEYQDSLPGPLQVKTAWDDRKDLAQRNVQYLQADILCVQECDSGMLDDIGMSRAIFIHHNHPQHKGHVHYHGVAILYNPDRFLFIERNRDFIYSLNGRMSVVADFQDNLTEKVIRVISVHLCGGRNRDSGFNQLEQVYTYISKKQKTDLVDCTILAGDFNDDKEGACVSFLKTMGMVVSSSLNHTEPDKNRTIDWIAVSSSQPLTVVPQSTKTLSPGASDHMPACVSISLEDISSPVFPSNNADNPQSPLCPSLEPLFNDDELPVFSAWFPPPSSSSSSSKATLTVDSPTPPPQPSHHTPAPPSWRPPFSSASSSNSSSMKPQGWIQWISNQITGLFSSVIDGLMRLWAMITSSK